MVNYKNILSIDTSGSALSGTWAVIGKGFSDVTNSVNKIIEDNAWINDEGYGNSEVVGAQLKFEATGKRKLGDTAQDYIFGDTVMYGLGEDCKTQIKFERVNPVTGLVVSTITVPATIVKAEVPGGKAQEGTACSFGVNCNGKPSFTVPYTAAQTLTVVSKAGTGAGKSSIYVNPAKGASNSLKFKIISALPTIGSVLTTGWTALTEGVDAIASGITTGDVIVVAEVITATNVLVKAGFATITTG